MKISNQYPPLFEAMKMAFPKCEEQKAVFCWGDTIYNPFDAEITPDLEVHESVHSRQQGNNPTLWTERYITDKKFRFEQELQAYSEQYRFVKNTLKRGKLVDWLLEKTAEALSGELYGSLISFNEARCKIRNLTRSGS